MKKIFTLLVASLFTVALFAADRKPSVTVKSNGNFEIVVDGKSYFSNSSSTIDLGRIRDGRHTISVYQVVNQGLFRKSKRMMSTSSFTVRDNDLKIKVDYNGKLQITEKMIKQQGGYGNNRDWDNNRNDNRNNQEMERHDRF